jgi:hypothetical protein
MKFVVASAAEAELGALFMNSKDAKIIRFVLEEMGHKQPPTPIHCDNKTAAGIANDSVKKTSFMVDGNVLLLGHRSGKKGVL